MGKILKVSLTKGFVIKFSGAGNIAAYYLAQWNSAKERYDLITNQDFEDEGTDLKALLKKAQGHLPALEHETVLAVWRK